MSDITIGKAAALAEVGVETVRFYERRGLIEQPLKPLNGGFRSYPPETVERIRFIRQAQTLGFSLEEIGELLSLRADPRTECGAMRDRAKAKLREVDEKLARLSEIRRALEAVTTACPGEGGLGACSILAFLETEATPPRSLETED